MTPDRLSPKTILIAMTITAAACGDQVAKQRAEIEALAARAAIATEASRAAEATRTKDIDAYMAQIPDDMDLSDGRGGSFTREQLREQVIQAWRSIRQTRALTVRIGQVILGRDSATVFLTQQWDRLVVRPDGKTVDTVVSESSRRETWRKTPAGWRSYVGVTTQSRVTMNGAPVLTVPALEGAAAPGPPRR